MIEIINTHNLKNITQIGTPAVEEEKVYIEDSVYTRIHVDELKEKRIFVFMGHTECEEGRYKTFVEGVIPVFNMEIIEEVPQWNTHAWSEVFREIKRNYTDSIIVGWAYDRRGVKPAANKELEAVHREHFGGIHQLLFLYDSDAGEENFFVLRSNRLYRKAGFYIFYGETKAPKPEPVDLEVEWFKEENSVAKRVSLTASPRQERGYTVTHIDEPEEMSYKAPQNARGYYRQLLQEKQTPVQQKKSPAAAMIVLLLLVGITAVAVGKNQNALKDIQTWVAGSVLSSEKGDSEKVDSQKDASEKDDSQKGDSQKESEAVLLESEDTQTAIWQIPVEKVDGGIETTD